MKKYAIQALMILSLSIGCIDSASAYTLKDLRAISVHETPCASCETGPFYSATREASAKLAGTISATCSLELPFIEDNKALSAILTADSSSLFKLKSPLTFRKDEEQSFYKAGGDVCASGHYERNEAACAADEDSEACSGPFVCDEHKQEAVSYIASRTLVAYVEDYQNVDIEFNLNCQIQSNDPNRGAISDDEIDSILGE